MTATIPIFDSLSHPTLTGLWITGDFDASFGTLDRNLRAAGFCGACAVGLAGTAGYSHELFLRACRSYPALVPVAGLDPTGPAPLATEIDRIADLGYRAVKVHPRLSCFEPTAEILGAIFQAASSRGLVIFYCTYLHTSIDRYPAADPFYALVGGLKRSPGAKVVLVHGGDVQALRYAELVRFNPDLLLDLSFTLLKYRGSSLDADISFLCREFDRRICIGVDHPEFTHCALRARFDELTAGLGQDKARNIAHRNLETFLGVQMASLP
ncbi:MAG TPA: amidohydrolase family protein [Thermoanaerobaculia bacterium]|nr:amidohydrolase family protein [Thermoanaerobaculia bacterium]